MALKEYKDSAIYIITMLVVFVVAFFYSPYRHADMVMAFGTSGVYGFVGGSMFYFGFAGFRKRVKKK